MVVQHCPAAEPHCDLAAIFAAPFDLYTLNPLGLAVLLNQAGVLFGIHKDIGNQMQA